MVIDKVEKCGEIVKFLIRKSGDEERDGMREMGN